MGFLKRITRSDFIIKLLHWEYWPFGIVQLPVIFYYFWLALKARSFLFFTASNPGIPMGGMFGESKFDILKKIPENLIPRTIKINVPSETTAVETAMALHGYQFPVIFKPDLGERGFMVKRIGDSRSVQSYLSSIRVDFLIQDLIDLPLEFGVLYERKPSALQGRVTSIVMKEMLSVTGDGHSTLKDLIFAKDRAKLQWNRLQTDFATRLSEVLPLGQKLELVSIGNHARGTKFLNGNHLINDQLNATFDRIAKQIPGFNFGRFDLRCQSLQDLYEGKIKIVELNGCGAEPAHIYDPEFKLFAAMGVLLRHWQSIFEIAMENHKLGVPFESLSNGREYYRKFKHATS